MNEKATPPCLTRSLSHWILSASPVSQCGHNTRWHEGCCDAVRRRYETIPEHFTGAHTHTHPDNLQHFTGADTFCTYLKSLHFIEETDRFLVFWSVRAPAWPMVRWRRIRCTPARDTHSDQTLPTFWTGHWTGTSPQRITVSFSKRHWVVPNSLWLLVGPEFVLSYPRFPHHWTFPLFHQVHRRVIRR